MASFKKAVRKKAKLRLGIEGPSGSGKSYTSLLIGKGLANGGKIAVIDTENSSASLYSHICDFDVADLDPPYTPER
jgi:pantothenate kinase-related protein Tda10